MEKIVTFYDMRVVKEKDIRYETATDINKLATSPQAVVDICKGMELETYAEEVVILFTLDTKNRINGAFIVSKGSLNGSIVSTREIFKRAIMQNSNAIIMVHNHPSGDTTPSSEDVSATRKIIEAGNLLEIKLLDHLIIGENYRYTSLKERGIV